MGSVLRVITVDADDTGRTAVAGHLCRQANLELVGAVATLTDAFTLLQAQPVDLLIADLEGLEYPPRMFLAVLAREAPATQVIVRTSSTDRPSDLLRAGARGYVHRRDPLHLMSTALLAVRAGWVYVSPTAQAALTASERLVCEWQLRWQDLDILRLLVHGYALCAIAQALELGEAELHARIDELKRRTNSANRVQLVDWYRRHAAECDGGGRADDGFDEGPAVLTRQENAVLQLLARGVTNRELADELSVAMSTVKYYVGNLLKKLGVSSRHEAVAVARQRGLLDHPPVRFERRRRASVARATVS